MKPEFVGWNDGYCRVSGNFDLDLCTRCEVSRDCHGDECDPVHVEAVELAALAKSELVWGDY